MSKQIVAEEEDIARDSGNGNVLFIIVQSRVVRCPEMEGASQVAIYSAVVPTSRAVLALNAFRDGLNVPFLTAQTCLYSHSPVFQLLSCRTYQLMLA
jgi:hypothetical protein